MLRLQGMDPSKFIASVSEFQLGKQLGNTMSVNVLERIMTRLLPAAGLVSGSLRDRWEDGSALEQLSATRGLRIRFGSALRGNSGEAPGAPRDPSLLMEWG